MAWLAQGNDISPLVEARGSGFDQVIMNRFDEQMNHKRYSLLRDRHLESSLLPSHVRGRSSGTYDNHLLGILSLHRNVSNML